MGFLKAVFELLVTAGIFHFATFAIGMIPLIYFEKWRELKRQQTDTAYNSELNRTRGILNRCAEFVFKYMSSFGMGMLLGTSFMLVIPEGVYSVLDSRGNIGFNLLFGFIVVYLLDSLLVHKMVGSSSEFDSVSVQSQFEESNDYPGSVASAGVTLRSVWDCINIFKTGPIILQNNVVFALVIHGLSDGVSLGAAATTESLKFVMYIAIIIHKIPAVLSLSTLMISKQKLSYYEVVTNLWAFALSTPLGYILVASFCMSVRGTSFMGPVAANLLLISGGSLLYAAFTAFSHNSVENDDPEGQEIGQESENTHRKNVMSLVAGAAIPAIVSFLIKE